MQQTKWPAKLVTNKVVGNISNGTSAPRSCTYPPHSLFVAASARHWARVRPSARDTRFVHHEPRLQMNLRPAAAIDPPSISTMMWCISRRIKPSILRCAPCCDDDKRHRVCVVIGDVYILCLYTGGRIAFSSGGVAKQGLHVRVEPWSELVRYRTVGYRSTRTL